MKNLAELLPFDEGTAVLEVPKDLRQNPVVSSSVTGTKTPPPTTRVETSHLKLVDEGFSYRGERLEKGWGRLAGVLVIAISVLLGVSGGRKAPAPAKVAVVQKKNSKTVAYASKRSPRRQKRR